MKTMLNKLALAVVLFGMLCTTAYAAGQSGCITCHADDAKMKVLVTFIPPLEGEGEG
ncbi:hypothetical protein [Geobacter sp. OR-1]|uniref:hypothetical protein n=1 Tax=Geobacter sp. OR-1 TaxID=1266765 RepID=UPI000A4A0672|nr:hypothetical protein [Geobacter sp. OR-1]